MKTTITNRIKKKLLNLKLGYSGGHCNIYFKNPLRRQGEYILRHVTGCESKFFSISVDT